MLRGSSLVVALLVLSSAVAHASVDDQHQSTDGGIDVGELLDQLGGAGAAVSVADPVDEFWELVEYNDWLDELELGIVDPQPVDNTVIDDPDPVFIDNNGATSDPWWIDLDPGPLNEVLDEEHDLWGEPIYQTP